MNRFATFQNDPFFSGIDLSQTRALDHRSSFGPDRQISQHDPNRDLFSNPFAFMQTMMGNMGQMISQMETGMNTNRSSGPNGHGVSFSSSTIMSMDRQKDGQPRIVQATSEKLHGPEGFERTRKAVRDTGRNVEKMEVAHRLGERGHRITQERDPSTGRYLENRQFEHIEDENQFEQEWFQRAERYGLKNNIGNGFNAGTQNLLMTPPSSYGRLRSQSQEPRHLAIEEAPASNNGHSRHRERRKN